LDVGAVGIYRKESKSVCVGRRQDPDERFFFSFAFAFAQVVWTVQKQKQKRIFFAWLIGPGRLGWVIPGGFHLRFPRSFFFFVEDLNNEQGGRTTPHRI
jgi:hypothetical protein